MKLALFSTKPYDRRYFSAINEELGNPHQLQFFEPRLSGETTRLAERFEAICIFVNDHLDGDLLETLQAGGTRLIALRCAGFNQVDLEAATKLGMAVVRVPAYSPHAVAEHTLALILGLNRKTHRAYNRVREMNFTLDGLIGFDLYGKTAGVIGTGIIGALVARILVGFGCKILAYDVKPNPEVEALGGQYVELPELYAESDLITLHCPLTPQTHHLINDQALATMKPGAMVINTSRGGVIDTKAVIGALKRGQLGALGLDVYEEEGDVFFEDLSSQVVQDDLLSRLMTFPNVLITGHQAFLTVEALGAIARTTLNNVTAFEQGQSPLPNAVTLPESPKG